jgi:glutaminyl-tRNA synthetase
MITSKRRCCKLVREGFVDGWDDPRMPTLAGMRRRGYPPAAIRDFCERAGVAKRDNVIEFELLELRARGAQPHREARHGRARPAEGRHYQLPGRAGRADGGGEQPEDPEAGTRKCRSRASCTSSARTFMVDPPKKYFRLRRARTCA